MTRNNALTDEIKRVREDLLERLTPDKHERARGQLAWLDDAPVAAIGVGDTAPGFDLDNIHGNRVSLVERLHAGPVVLSFFRGAWCSFCNLELRALQRRLPQIEALGATLLAISAESAEHSAKVVERHHLSYDILVDAANRVAHDYGLISTPDENLCDFDERFEVNLGTYNAEGDPRLPLPASYVIAPEGEIVAAHVMADWTQRMEPDEIIEHLRGLQQR